MAARKAATRDRRKGGGDVTQDRDTVARLPPRPPLRRIESKNREDDDSDDDYNDGNGVGASKDDDGGIKSHDGSGGDNDEDDGSENNVGATSKSMGDKPSRARELALELLEMTPEDDDDDNEDLETIHARKERRRIICSELLGHLVQLREKATAATNAAKERSLDNDDDDTSRTEENGDGFIRTALSDYNNKDSAVGSSGRSTTTTATNVVHAAAAAHDAGPSIRDLLGNLPSSTTSKLASVLTRLLTDRVETSKLLPGTQDERANREAMGMAADDDDDDDDDHDDDDDDDENDAGRKGKKKRKNSAKSRASKNGGRGSDPFGAAGSSTATNATSTSTEACGRAAMTLSSQSLLAAEIYALLVSSRGAWGAGLVEVGGLSAVSALVRRWCLECRGREPGGGSRRGSAGSRASSRGGGGKKNKRARRENDTQRKGSRKSTRARPSVSFASSGGSYNLSDDDEDQSYSIEVTREGDEEEVDEQLTEHNLILRGLSLATTLGRAPLTKDYKNWSAEAREAHVDACSAALASGAALLAGLAGVGNNGDDAEVARACRRAMESLEMGLGASLLPPPPPRTTDKNDAEVGIGRARRRRSAPPPPPLANSDVETVVEESVIYLLRGLAPVLAMKLELPNGQKGKEAARTASSRLVAQVTKVACEEEEEKDRTRRLQAEHRNAEDRAVRRSGGVRTATATRTATPPIPSSVRRKGMPTATKTVTINETPMHGRGGRSPMMRGTVNGVGNVIGGGGGGARSPVPPSLKKTALSPKRMQHHHLNTTPSACNNSDERRRRHPVLSKVVGLLQRTFTSRGLERAEARSRVSAFGLTCLEHLPSEERSGLCKFVAKMCESKLSRHRLFGVELIGEILCRGWVWTDFNPDSGSTGGGGGGDEDLAATPRLGTILRNSNAATYANNDGESAPVVLLRALQGRLTDTAPAVRARAAHSLGEAIRKTTTIETSLEAGKDNHAAQQQQAARCAFLEALLDVGPSLVSSLRRRASVDDKANVRKASISAWIRVLLLEQHRPQQNGEYRDRSSLSIVGIGIKGGIGEIRSSIAPMARTPATMRSQRTRGGLLGGVGPTRTDVSVLATLCLDNSVATRKAAAEALTQLLQSRYGDVARTMTKKKEEDATEDASALALTSTLEMAWSSAVLPLVLDAETTCVSKAVEFFASVVVDPILEGEGSIEGDDGEDDVDNTAAKNEVQLQRARYQVAWRVLSSLSEGTKEAGAARSGTGSLRTALRRLFIERAGNDGGRKFVMGLLEEVRRVGVASLGLEEDEGDEDDERRGTMDSAVFRGQHLFDAATEARRVGAWCFLDAITGCLSTDTTSKASSSLSSSTSSSSATVVTLQRAVKNSSISSSFLVSSWKKLRCLHSTPENHADAHRRTRLAATSRDCLRIIARMGSFVPPKDAESCFGDLRREMESFRISTDLVGAGVSALVALGKRISDDDNNDGDSDEEGGGGERKDAYATCEEWVGGIFNNCETAIDSYFASLTNSNFENDPNSEADAAATENNKTIEDRTLERVIFLVGELSLVGFSSDEDTSKLTTSTKKKRETPSINDPVKGLLVRPSARLVDLIKLLLPPSLPAPKTPQQHNLGHGGDRADNRPRPTPRAVRAHAFIALGKLCLRDEKLAKECLTILARELSYHNERDSDPAVQSNALLVMGDLCVRYTNLVDKYLPVMASCIQAGETVIGGDGNENGGGVGGGYTSIMAPCHNYSVVKKHAILLLSGLLLQDYIKWRGLLVHRFFAASVDDDEEVACLARATLTGPLLGKQRNLFFNGFVEAIFVLNGCKAHPIYAAAAGSGDNGSGLAVEFGGTKNLIAGREGCRRRLEVYRMMLGHMSDEEKLGVTARLVKEVLGGALETSGDLSVVCRIPPEQQAAMFSSPKTTTTPGKKSPKKTISNQRAEAAVNVLTDTLAILTSPDVRVGRKTTEEADPDEEHLATSSSSQGGGGTGAASKSEQLSAVKGRLLTKISRKHLMETVVPILCNLKTILEASRSPLLKELMKYLVYIFRSYKSEVKELLANDPTLLQELEYDTRQYDKKRRESLASAQKKVEKGRKISFEGAQQPQPLQSIEDAV